MGYNIITEKRKIQLTGGSTYIISLPINWIRDVGLTAGDSLTISQQPDKTLILSSEPKISNKKSKVTIKLFHSDDPEDNFRVLVAHYLVGYDIIKLVSQKGFSTTDRKFIKDTVRQRLIGLEVLEESGNELVLQSFLNYGDLPLDKAMKSMSRLVSSMLDDAIRALHDNDRELAQDIIQRDDEVDRFYLLTVRQIKAVLEDPSLSEKIGISNPRTCLGYRLITKSIERIGDHVERIAQNIVRIDHGIEEKDQILKLARFVSTIFNDAIQSLSKNDLKFSNNVISNTKKASDLYETIDEKKRNKTDYIYETEIRSIIVSLHRISEYSADIAEISINIGVEKHQD